MTCESAKQLLPIVKAYADGQSIQVKSGPGPDDWEDINDPVFTRPPSHYRIKPEPTLILQNPITMKLSDATLKFLTDTGPVQPVNRFPRAQLSGWSVRSHIGEDIALCDNEDVAFGIAEVLNAARENGGGK